MHWSQVRWPKVSGQPSIDNHYLLLLLMHGSLAAGFLLLLFLHVGGRLFLHGMNETPAAGGSFAMTLFGCIAGVYVAVATVFMGLNTQPLLFVLLGWGEGFLLFGRRVGTATARVAATAPLPAFRFRRVLA